MIFRNKFPLFLLIVWLFSFASLFAQKKLPDWKVFNGKILNKIIVLGNKHTESRVILREVQLKPGEVFNDSLMRRSKERIENLWLFNRVEVLPFGSGDSVSVIINVTERWYFFPYPVFDLEDRDWNKITYGFGFAHLNFRGWNEKLQASIHFGNRPGLKFSYYNPWIGDQLHLFGGFYFRTFRKENYLYGFPEHHLLTVLHFGKYWTRDFYTVIKLIRDRVRVDDENKPYMVTGKATEVNMGLRLTTTFDYRDLYAYPSHGWFLRLGIYRMGLFLKNVDYVQYLFDFRKYFYFKPFIFASRLYTLQSYGTAPVYDLVFLGYNERIRGHFSEVYSGKHAMIAAAALRWPIIPVRYFSLGEDNAMSEYVTKDLKFGLNMGIFVESGQVWNRHSAFSLRKMITGYGVGLHFLLPYVEVLRLDLAFNEQRKSEFIVEILMPF